MVLPIKYRRQKFENLLIGLHTMSNSLLKVLQEVFQPVSSLQEDIRPLIRNIAKQYESMNLFINGLSDEFLSMAQETVTCYIDLIGGTQRTDRTIVEVVWDVYSRLVYERPLIISPEHRFDTHLINLHSVQWITECIHAPVHEANVSVTLREYRARDAVRRVQLHAHHVLSVLQNLFPGKKEDDSYQTRCYLLTCYETETKKDLFLDQMEPLLFHELEQTARSYEILGEFIVTDENVDWPNVLWEQIIRTIYESPCLINGQPDMSRITNCLEETVVSGMSTRVPTGVCPTTATTKLYRMQFLSNRIDVSTSFILKSVTSSESCFDKFCLLLETDQSLNSDLIVFARTYMDYHRIAKSEDMCQGDSCSLKENEVLKHLWSLCLRSIGNCPDTNRMEQDSSDGKNMTIFRKSLHDLGPCIAAQSYFKKKIVLQ
jgi:hypothetical protein